MVPQVIPGMVTQFVPGLVPQFVSTESDQQSVGKPLIQLANSHVEARHTGLPSVTYALPPQTVVSRMNDLKISIGTPQLVQKPVYAEKRDQSAKTEGRDLTTRDSHGLSATPRVSDRGFLVKLCRKSATPHPPHPRKRKEEKQQLKNK